MKKIILSSIIVLFFAAVPVFATSTVVYDNIPNPTPGNVPSIGFEATSTYEFGGQVGLVGIDRYNPTVAVLMSSWGCESGTWVGKNCLTAEGATFSHPVTLNVYNVNADNTVGSLITTNTTTFNMPYRPSADTVKCTGVDEGKWHDGTACVNGIAFPISFDLTGILPDKVIIGVAYNTSHYGASPLGESADCYATPQGCPYDSLNVGTAASPSVGTALPTAADVYLNSTWSGAYCNGALGTGIFRLDAGCWEGYLPSIKVDANPALTAPPTNMGQCKKDGWKTFNNPSYKNQGECVSYVQSNEQAGN